MFDIFTLVNFNKLT